MSTNHSTMETRPELTQQHATNCVLMIRLIHDHHCPKQAHMIVQQLEQLLTDTQPNKRQVVTRCLNNPWNSGKKLLAICWRRELVVARH